jgi:cytochrome c-type biogenesis protein CcmH
MRRLRGMLLVCLIAVGLPAAAMAATNPDEILQDPVLEQRARDLSRQLRCLVCQNQSIDDSDADLARDLRRIVREQLLAGRSDEEIIDYLTARYGDFVLLKPPVKPATWGLWFGPAAVLLIAAAGIGVYVRRRAAPPDAPTPELSADERRRLEALLREESRRRGPERRASASQRRCHQPDDAGMDGDRREPGERSRKSALVHRSLVEVGGSRMAPAAGRAGGAKR